MRNTFKDNVLRVVAVLGLIAVLLLGAWGIIQLAFWLPSLFGGATDRVGGIFRGSPAKEALTMSLPATVTSGTPFTINFSSRNAPAARTFGLAYQCRDGVSLAVALPGKDPQKVACDTPFKLEGATTSVRVTPTLVGTTATPVGVSMAATDAAGAIVATSTGGTTVAPARAGSAGTSGSAGSTKPAASAPRPVSPASSYYASGRTSNLYGLPDLAITVNSAYVSGTRAVVQFTVANAGTNAVPAGWYFSALLPLNGGYPYQSPTQQKLYPGDRIVFTMAYDTFAYGYGYGYGGYGAQSATITVDPYNAIAESAEFNNTATASYGY